MFPNDDIPSLETETEDIVSGREEGEEVMEEHPALHSNPSPMFGSDLEGVIIS